MARGRMIDKVIILSTKINTVSEGAENLYYRIYVNTDDFGLFHADPRILKGQVYTLRNISVLTIEKRLNELIEIGLVKIYKSNNERYLEVVDFEKHQIFRKDYVKKYEYPKPNTNSYEPVRTSTKSPTKLNKIKLNKNKLSSSCLEKFQDEEIRLTQLLIDLMIKNNPNSTIIRDLTPRRKENWINECRLLREKDERSNEEIEQIIIFSQNDSFWKTNILSMSKLRKQYDQLWLKNQDKGGSKLTYEEKRKKGLEDWVKKPLGE